MTNLRKILLVPALIIASVSSFISCGVDRWPEYAHQIALDTWIYDTMKLNYLWYQDMPSMDDVNLFLQPDAFLDKVKSSKDSYSFADSIMETPLPTYGFDYSLVRSIDIDTAYNALITYVIPGSPAAEAGLRRGDWVMKVDTSFISKKYETKLLQGTRAQDLVMGAWTEIIPEPEEGQETVTPYYKVVANEDTLKLGVARVVEDNPVHDYKTIVLDNGMKVGYLMYNSFTAGTKANPEMYNDELRRISKEFQTADIQAMILDLRYNAGGSMDCAQLLGTILVPDARLDTPMAFLEYNDKNTDKDIAINFDRAVLKTGVNLNQKILFVITSGTTAGAAEMLIGGLYIKDQEPAIIAIGSRTKGQNVATEQFINEEFRWSINPVVCTVYNSMHEEAAPFAPGSKDFEVSESTIDGKTDYRQFLPFGDPNERLLNIAILTLEGKYPPAKPETPTPSAHFKIEKSVSSPASRRFVGGGGLRIK